MRPQNLRALRIGKTKEKKWKNSWKFLCKTFSPTDKNASCLLRRCSFYAPKMPIISGRKSLHSFPMQFAALTHVLYREKRKSFRIQNVQLKKSFMFWLQVVHVITLLKTFHILKLCSMEKTSTFFSTRYKSFRENFEKNMNVVVSAERDPRKVFGQSIQPSLSSKADVEKEEKTGSGESAMFFAAAKKKIRVATQQSWHQFLECSQQLASQLIGIGMKSKIWHKNASKGWPRHFSRCKSEKHDKQREKRRGHPLFSR